MAISGDGGERNDLAHYLERFGVSAYRPGAIRPVRVREDDGAEGEENPMIEPLRIHPSGDRDFLSPAIPSLGLIEELCTFACQDYASPISIALPQSWLDALDLHVTPQNERTQKSGPGSSLAITLTDSNITLTSIQRSPSGFEYEVYYKVVEQ